MNDASSVDEIGRRGDSLRKPSLTGARRSASGFSDDSVKTSLLASIAVALPLGAWTTAAEAAPPTFATTTVSEQEPGAEPGLAVDLSSAATRGTIYYIAPSSSALFVSTDGGVSFSPGAEVHNDGDADVAVDDGGNVFTSGLLDPDGFLNTTIPVQALAPGGTTVLRSRALVPDASTGVACDRQWTAAHGVNHVVTSAVCDVNQIWLSTDGWASVEGPFTIDADASFAGPLLFAPNGDLLQAYETSDGTFAARSSNEGRTWSREQVSSDTGSNSFDVIAVDDGGTAYVVYATFATTADENGGGSMVFFSRRRPTDAGWSPPVALSSQTYSPLVGNTPSAIFPWVTAGAAGKVAVSWYQARDPVGGETDIEPETGLPTTTWDVVLARSDTADAELPVWTTTTAISGFHRGSICTFGLACPGPQNFGLTNLPTPFDRRDLDFFETAISPAGELYIAFPKDRPAVSTNVEDDLFTSVDLLMARQTGGDLLK
jgi:hypothetical protein